MRFAFAIFLGIHGAIHLTLAATGGLFAFGWLGGSLLLGAAAVLSVTKHEPWWRVALAGVVISQCLIIVVWGDTKLLTIANVVVLAVAVTAAAHAGFSRKIDAEIRALFGDLSGSPTPLLERDELARLPPPVGRWLERSGVVGKERAFCVRLRQRGELRTSPHASWLPARAEQYFSIEKPGFIWRVDATAFNLLAITGRDKYFAGKGHMLIKLESLVSLVDAADEKIDLGTMLRFLGEIVWFPSAALCPYIEWEPVDRSSAKATMRYAGMAASAQFSFDELGRVTSMSAERYLGGGADAKLTPWLVPCTDWRVIRGIEVPVRGEVVWRLASGDFSYYRWEILDVECNTPEAY